MVDRLNNVIHIDRRIGEANGVCLKDKACLVMCQTTPFDMVGVIGQVDLRTMIYTALQS